MGEKKTAVHAGNKGLTRYLLLFAVVVVSIIFGILQPKFFSVRNWMNIVSSTSLVGIMAVGMTIVMSTNEMELATGCEATIAAAVAGRLLLDGTFPSYILAVIIGLAVSVCVGLLNSFFVLKLSVPSFIETIAVTTLIDGFISLATNNSYMFSNKWPSSYAFLGQTRVAGIIPVPAIIFVAIVIVMIFVMDHTKLGRYIGSVGANPTACTNVGINNKKIKMICFLLCALLCGIDGILTSSQVLSVSPTLGQDVLMDAMAATMMGATFLRVGRYNIQGTVVAALLITVIQNGITSVGAPNFVEDIVTGTILIISIGVIAMTRKEGLPSVTFNE